MWHFGRMPQNRLHPAYHVREERLLVRGAMAAGERNRRVLARTIHSRNRHRRATMGWTDERIVPLSVPPNINHRLHQLFQKHDYTPLMVR